MVNTGQAPLTGVSSQNRNAPLTKLEMDLICVLRLLSPCFFCFRGFFLRNFASTGSRSDDSRWARPARNTLRFGFKCLSGTVGDASSVVLRWTYKSTICNFEANWAMMRSAT